jgi:glycosyltransferase involved in cell wall biosynthesis
MTSVDVVVPCYRYGHFLDKCVKSVLTQSGPSVRVLILDDASPDNTSEVAADLARHDSRVTLLRHTTNKGHIATYNEGIEWAAADYFLLLSADDWLVPGALTRATEVFTDNPQVVLTCGNAATANANEPASTFFDYNLRWAYRITPGPTFIENACANAAFPPIWTPTAIVRTITQKEIGGYSNSLPHAGDLEMWLRFACRGSVALLDAYQAVYRQHTLNMHHSFGKLANLRQHLLAFESAFEKEREKLSTHADLKRKYRRAIAIGALKLADDALLDGEPSIYRECVAFALGLYPEISTSRWWYEIRMKALIGCEPVNAVKQLVKPVLRAFGTRWLDC